MISKSSQRGITMIELLVSIAIFAIVTAVVLVGFVGSRKHGELRLAADQLVNDLRRLQTAAIAGQAVGGSVPKGFGLTIDFTNARQYHLFADTMTRGGSDCGAGANQRNDIFLGGTCAAEPQVQAAVALPGAVRIDKLYIGSLAITTGRTDVAFTTPEATVHVHYGTLPESHQPGNAAYVPDPSTNQIIYLCVYHENLNLYRQITVLGATGQIDVTNAIDSCQP